MSLRSIIMRIRDLFEIGDDSTAMDGGRSPLTPAKVQKAIETGIADTGVKTNYSKSLVFGNLMLVHVSREAAEVLRPVERTALDEIEQHLPDKLRRQGWTLENRLRIQVIPDPNLSGLSVRVTASDADVTRQAHGIRHEQARAKATPHQTAGPTVRLFQKKTKRSWVIAPDREVLLGRASTGIEIGIDDAAVSRVHASLKVERGADGQVEGLLIKDLESSFGTQVAGKSVPKGGTDLARNGDTVRFAGVETRVVIGDDYQTPTRVI